MRSSVEPRCSSYYESSVLECENQVIIRSGQVDSLEYLGIPDWYTSGMKIGVSLPADLVRFADQAARSRGTSRSVLLARLLEAERVRQQIVRYLDRHGWDVADDEEKWRKYQRRRMAAEYRADEW